MVPYLLSENKLIFIMIICVDTTKTIILLIQSSLSLYTFINQNIFMNVSIILNKTLIYFIWSRVY